MNLRKLELKAAETIKEQERLDDLMEFKKLVEEADVIKRQYPSDPEFSFMNRESFNGPKPSKNDVVSIRIDPNDPSVGAYWSAM